MATITHGNSETVTQPHGNGLIHSSVGCIGDSYDKNFSEGHTNGVDRHESVEEQNNSPVIDISINNVVCSFSVRCHLNLRQIALTGSNVEFRKANGMVTMKLRNPSCTASMWSSGKVTCTGATSEDASKQAARKVARSLQKLGFNVRFNNFRVVNVLGTCSMPFAIKISAFSQHHRGNASYEPELHPGVTYKIKELSATLKIFSTGSITVTAPSVCNIQLAIEHIYPLVLEHKKDKFGGEEVEYPLKKKAKLKHNYDHIEIEDDDSDFGEEIGPTWH